MENDNSGPELDRAIKISVPLHQAVHAALTAEAKGLRREFTEHVQRLLAEHVIERKTIERRAAARLQLTWRLVDRAVEEARRICREGGFTSAITLTAIQACMKDPTWVEDYRNYVLDDIYKNGNPLKGPINREIGYQIRAGIGGRVVKTADNKPANVKVLGQIIQSYTPMGAFDAAAVR